MFLLYSSTLHLFWILAWYKWHQHGFLQPNAEAAVISGTESPELLLNGVRLGVGL